jgi:phenylalanyl-tRNA synthetase beta chain
VDQAWSDAFSPWTDQPALRSLTPVLRGSDRLRRSLVPSLLGARHTNESLANETIELFEIARVYLPRGASLPTEELSLALTSGKGFLDVKGVVEALLAELNPTLELVAEPTQQSLFDPQRSAQLRLRSGKDEKLVIGYLGELAPAALKQFQLRGPTTVAELRLAPLIAAANLVPVDAKQSQFPVVSRDLNLVVAESIDWARVADTVRSAARPYAEALLFRDVYRDAERLGQGKKSLLMTLTLRSDEATLTNEQADQVRDRVVAACRDQHGAELRA